MAGGPKLIVHLTDIHFGRDHALAISGGEAPLRHSLLDLLVADLQSFDRAPDLVVISGDLVSLGTRDEFLSARTFLDELCKAFSLRPENFLIVPGNHDIYWGKGPDSVSRGEYEGFFSTFFRVPVTEVGLPVRIVDTVGFIGVDTTRLDRQSTSGIGLIGQDQLRDAGTKAKQRFADVPLKFLVQHHHLLPVAWMEPGEPHEAKSLTLDAPTVLGWTQENGFTGILHGHQHQSFLTTFHMATKRGGPILVAGGPSAGARDLPPQGRNGYHLFLIDGIHITVSLREVSQENRFVEARRVEFLREASGTFAASAIPSARHAREPSVAELRALMREAARSVREVVSESFGPKGGLRIVTTLPGLRHARDGGLISRSVTTSDPVQARIVELASGLAREMEHLVGGGRKTALLLWSEMVLGGVKAIDEGHSDLAVTKGLRTAAILATSHLRTLTTAATTDDAIKNIANTAAQDGGYVGDKIVEAFKLGGKEGVMSMRKANAPNPSSRRLVVTARTHSFSGVRRPDSFANISALGKVFENPALVLFDGDVEFAPLVPILELVAASQRPIIIVARKFSDVALGTLAMNVVRGVLLAMPLTVHFPTGNGALEDLGVLSGARVFTASLGESLVDVTAEHFGNLETAHFANDELTVIPNTIGKDNLMMLVSKLREHASQLGSDYERERVQIRLARLVGAEVEIEVAGTSAIDTEIFSSLVSDAVHAARAAAEAGLLPGGGAALLASASAVRNELSASGQFDEGVKVFCDALQVPSSLIGQPIDASVVDSTKVITLAVELAVDLAVRTLMTRTVEMREARLVDDSSDDIVVTFDKDAPF